MNYTELRDNIQLNREILIEDLGLVRVALQGGYTVEYVDKLLESIQELHKMRYNQLIDHLIRLIQEQEV